MSEPNTRAVEQAELLLRRLRTGELSGFVAVATDADDISSWVMGGRINFTQTVCLLEDMKLRCLNEWCTHFFKDDEQPIFEVVSSPEPEES